MAGLLAMQVVRDRYGFFFVVSAFAMLSFFTLSAFMLSLAIVEVAAGVPLVAVESAAIAGVPLVAVESAAASVFLHAVAATRHAAARTNGVAVSRRERMSVILGRREGPAARRRVWR